MSETGSAPLEQKRFIINPESMAGMKILRTTYQELHQEYPYLSGLGYFGSRTKGTEYAQSDYDVCVFYNSDRITSLNEGTRDQWQKIISTLELDIGGSLDYRIHDPSGGLRIDISQKTTDNELKALQRIAEPFLNPHIDEDLVLKKIAVPPIQNLHSRFFLAVGEEVYANRHYIFDQLRETPDGDGYLQILMKSLGAFERGNHGKRETPLFEGYPRTIDEAEQYFINRDR